MHPLHPGESLSEWLDSTERIEHKPLTQDLEVDVCIVGGGMGGLTTAYLLMKQGIRVAVLEAFELGSGQTGRSTAQFSTALDRRYFQLEKFHGLENTQLIAESHRAAIQKVEQIIRDEKIDCEFEYVSGYLFKGDDDLENDTLAKELVACRRVGLSHVRSRDQLAVRGLEQTANLHFPEQAQLHPLKYLNGLARAITKGGGCIFTNSFVDQIKGGLPAMVKTRDGHKVTCKSIVVATNTPINDIFAIHTKQYAYRSYVMAFRIPEGAMEKALYWDTSDPYHYIRLEGKNVMIVGGEDHKTGQEDHPEKCYEELETWVRNKFTFAEEVLYKWSGQIMESMDGLAFLGHNPLDRDNVYVITGDSGLGMTHATIGGLLITDQILGRPNAWEDLYDPSRVVFNALGTYLKENVNVAAQYADWVTTKTGPNLDALPYGQGMVFRHGMQMVAAYKDGTGSTQLMSAVCPHLGAVLKWNTAEKSWDCPCHGSRFDCSGKVIEGPAVTDLKKLNLNEGDLAPETTPLIKRTGPSRGLSLGSLAKTTFGKN